MLSRIRIVAVIWLLLVSGVLSGAQATDRQPALKIALLPIVDTLPFYVAQATGYFEALDLQVRAIPVGSGLERDQLMQAGELDGMLNEMISSANFNRHTIKVKVVAKARQAYPQYPLFRILAAPDSEIATPGDLVGVPLGISQNTIIEYVTDRLLAVHGLKPAGLVKLSVPVIPERFQLLLQGRLKAAVLPDPLAMSAIESGARAVADDAGYALYSTSVLTFDAAVLKNRSEQVRRFMQAWDRAVVQINADPEKYRPLMLSKIRVPPNVRQTYRIPPYPRASVPTRKQWQDVMDWMVTKGMLTAPLPYGSSVTDEYLP